MIQTAPLPRVKAARLLLVGGDPESRKRCFNLFESAGYSVTVASTGREAARAALDSRYDVAVLDYRLPDCRGTALVRWLKRRRPGMATIVFSAYADWDLFFHATGAGARDVVARTSSPSELLRVVRNNVRA